MVPEHFGYGLEQRIGLPDPSYRNYPAYSRQGFPAYSLSRLIFKPDARRLSQARVSP
jgi:hypothetical protein